MPTWQAHAVSFLMRQTFKKKLAKAAVSRDVKGLRRVMSLGGYKVSANIDIRLDSIGGVPGEWVQRQGETPETTMLYLHGGGYFACSPKTHRPASCAFAKAGMRVFVPDYRLAPEHPFPAALEDATPGHPQRNRRRPPTGPRKVAAAPAPP